MSDIEKYGLFAVLFVGGILLLIAVGGGFSDDPPAVAAASGAPVVLDQPTAMRPPQGQSDGLGVVRVSPLLPTDKPFTFTEPPVAYPGERTASVPATQSALPAQGTSMVLDAPNGASTAVATYVIKDGDTLADIAQHELGSAKRWDELVKLNPGLDPKRLKIGQTIRLSGSAPAVLAAPAAPVPASSALVAKSDAPRTHTVASGETLGAIARKYLGTATKADAIHEANRDVLKSPDTLSIGQVLRIP